MREYGTKGTVYLKQHKEFQQSQMEAYTQVSS